MSERGLTGVAGRRSSDVVIDPGPAGRPPEGQAERRGTEASDTVRAQVRAAMRERRLGVRLERSLDGVAHVLHHRLVDHSSYPVDHLVVASNGVWVVRAVHAVGKVVIDRAERTVAVGAGDSQLVLPLDSDHNLSVAALERTVAGAGFDWVPVRRTMCLTKATLHRDRDIDGALVTTPRRLISSILEPGQLILPDVRTIAAAIDARFAPAGVSGNG